MKKIMTRLIETGIKAILFVICTIYVLWVTDTIHIMMGWPYQVDRLPRYAKINYKERRRKIVEMKDNNKQFPPIIDGTYKKDDPHQDIGKSKYKVRRHYTCLLYTSPSPRDLSTSRMPSSA